MYKLTVLIDSGASVSLYSSGYTTAAQTDDTRVTWIQGKELAILSSELIELDLDLRGGFTRKLLVANIPYKLS